MKKPEDLISIPLDNVPLDQPLPCAIYLIVADTVTLFRKAGEKLSTQRTTTLSEQVSNVYFEKREWNEYLDRCYKIDTSKMKDDELVSHVRQLLLGFSKAWEEFKKLDEEVLHKTQVLVDRLAFCLKKDPKLATSILRRYADTSHYYSNHSVNVTIYSILIGLKLGFSVADVKLMAFAALCHNLGNMLVPKKILHKKEKLTKEEWEIIRRHPAEGAATLELFGAPRELIRVAHEHHETLDQKGYPSRVGRDEIHPFSKICSVADCFDAMTSPRPYAKALSSTEAIREMVQMEGKFDPSILKMIH